MCVCVRVCVGGVAGGVNGCVERSSGRVWGVFLNSFRSSASC